MRLSDLDRMEFEFKVEDADLSKLAELLADVNIKETPWFDVSDKHGNSARYYREGQWIPCSERLPDYEGYDEVLTTVNGRAENVRYINAVITNAEYDDTDKQWYINGCAAKWVARNGKVMSDVDVLAWMPLPEPYQPEEESE